MGLQLVAVVDAPSDVKKGFPWGWHHPYLALVREASPTCGDRTFRIVPRVTEKLLGAMRASSKFRCLPEPVEVTDPVRFVPIEKKPTSATWPSDCGNERCPICAHKIEARKDAEHAAKVASTIVWPNWISEWFADLYGTGADRGDALPAPYKKPSQSSGGETVRVARPIPASAREEVVETLLAYKPHRSYAKPEWRSEVWLEVTNPSALCCRRERYRSWGWRLQKAIDRSQAVMRRRSARTMTDKARFVLDASRRVGAGGET